MNFATLQKNKKGVFIVSKWPDQNDPSATFYSERVYNSYRSNEHNSHNSPARSNPEVLLFNAMADFEKTYKNTAEDDLMDKALLELQSRK